MTDVVVRRLRAAGCVFAEEEAALLVEAASGPDELADLLARREAGTPLEHLLGWAEFGGLRVQVLPGVFVPRRRTEALARQALEVLPRAARFVVEACCGSGAVSAVLRSVRPELELVATDVDPVAVNCASLNLPGATVLLGDLLDPVPHRLRGSVDLVVANVPHVPTAEIVLMPTEARDHEATVALDGGVDGLQVLRRLAAQASGWLAPAGALVVEVGARQVGSTLTVFGEERLAVSVEVDDEVGTAVVTGRRRS